MEFQFLGSSSGTPTKTRNVTALALRADNARQWYLVDCGEGTQHRILSTSLSLASLRAIFITHVHGDHCYGLPGLLASAGMQNRTEPMLLAGPQAVRHFLDGVMQTTQLKLPYEIEFIDVEAMPTISALPDFRVQATALSHRVPTYAYSFTEQAVEARLDAVKLASANIPAGPLWGRIQRGEDVVLPDGRAVRASDYLLPLRKPRKIIVGGDNDTPGLLAHEARDADVLIHEATYTEAVLSKVGPGPQHSSAKRVAQFASEAKIRNLVLTHFSPRYQEQKGEGIAKGGLSLADIHTEEKVHYSGSLFLANDFECYLLDKAGVLSKLQSP
ncbi:MBL fold metallo-hydrolase [Noviherbaspirillum sedimenti]|uniref:Ribonuclease Z n=2 Tax=Noviherbaspirillum sedimenti TaxID=2320865 RepID=A0A3A3GQ59_9BURK|nr:MBL fold metallo-hydrolase [Noviherbaspirillum sedimenti]